MAGEHSDLQKVELSKTTLLESEKNSPGEQLLSSAYSWINDNKVDLGIYAVGIASVGAAVLARKFLGGATIEGAEMAGGSHVQGLLGQPERYIAHDDAILGGRIGVNPNAINPNATEAEREAWTVRLAPPVVPREINSALRATAVPITPSPEAAGSTILHNKFMIIDDSALGGRIIEKLD